MQLRMWSYDLAREQCPSLDFLRELCDLTLSSGYNALGLYLEHRFVYASAPWAAGGGALRPETVRTLIEEFPDLQIIPFVNLLGHMEGFLYAEGGAGYAEERFKGMQACPSKPEFVAFASGLLEDILQVFSSEIIHIGADEVGQLGKCPLCAERVRAFEEANPGKDGRAMLFGQHFAPLAAQVIERGRKPGVWGDMFVEHPDALAVFPKETVIFDWQYFSSPIKSAKPFIEAGYETVVCPTLITYSAPWFHLPQGELNVTENVRAAHELEAFGVCVTTWECELFGNYGTLLPAISAAGAILSGDSPLLHNLVGGGKDEEGYTAQRDAPYFMKSYLRSSETYEEWARLMGVELQECGGLFAYGSMRSAIKTRLLLYSNPFLLWLRNREELLGPGADQALAILDRAIAMAPDTGARGVSEFVRIAIEFVRHVEESAVAYGKQRPGEATAALAPARAGFDDLAKIAKATHLAVGGSLADIERCRVAKEHVEKVIRRIKEFGDGSLGYLPSYETICHPKFVPHDQGNWWLINDWANE